jgi:hypothetical protein
MCRLRLDVLGVRFPLYNGLNYTRRSLTIARSIIIINGLFKHREQCDVLLIVSSRRALLVYFRMSAAASNKQQQHHHNDPIEAGAGAVATKGTHCYDNYFIALFHELCLY